jgi:hypothetical protein
MATQQDVPISKIYLDNDNPRHDHIDSEPAIVAALLKSEKVVQLAKNIAKNGALNPLDLLGLLPHPTISGSYIVAEGNRRACALKLLSDPKKAPTAALKRTFESLSAKLDAPIKKVSATVFDSEEEARIWKAIRHEGEQGGVGVRRWKAAAQTRHNMGGSKRNPNILALSLRDYAKSAGVIDANTADRVSITTLARYLSNPVFRHDIGITSPTNLEVDVPEAQFNRVVERFIRDALPRDDGQTSIVNSRSNTPEIKKYAKSLRTEGLLPTTRFPQSRQPSPAKATTSKTRRDKHPDKRRSVIPQDLKPKITDVILRRVYEELREIDPFEFSFAAAYLMRAFIEMTAKLYAKKHGLPRDGELHAIIQHCAKHLESTAALQALKKSERDGLMKPLNVMSSDKHSRTSPDSMGAFVHGSSIPTGAELIRRWDTIEPSMTALLAGL